MSQRYHLVENAAKRPDVWLLVVRLLLANLGRQVVWRADRSLSAVVGVLQNARDAEVADLDLVVLGHENVLRLKIAMQDFAIVDVLDGKSHLHEPVEDLVFWVAD